MSLSYATRRLLKFLETRRGDWVSVVEFRALGLRFYRQRIYDLRRAGYRIEMHREYVEQRYDTCYRLLDEGSGDNFSKCECEGGPNGQRSGSARHAETGPGVGRAA